MDRQFRIGILYICTGKYDVFWKDFYDSCEKHFCTNSVKKYFVFTDSEKIYKESENPNIRKIFQKNLGWPGNTLKRFEIFVKAEESFKDCDYLFFFNANMLFVEDVTEEEFLPTEKDQLLAVKHPGYFNQTNKKFPYERNPKSLAGINYGEGENYFMGGLNGGVTEHFVKLIKILKENTKIDESNGIIATWHDESHINKYLLGKQIKVLPPSYGYPEDWKIPFVPKIIIRDKRKIASLNELRGKMSYCDKFLRFIKGVIH